MEQVTSEQGIQEYATKTTTHDVDRNICVVETWVKIDGTKVVAGDYVSINETDHDLPCMVENKRYYIHSKKYEMISFYVEDDNKYEFDTDLYKEERTYWKKIVTYETILEDFLEL